MNKYEAVAKYLSSRPKVKYFIRNVDNELCDMKKAWKKDEFAPSVKELSNLSNEDFVSTYFNEYKDTVQHELAEAVEHIVLFAEAHGVDILEYLQYLEKFRNLMNEKSIGITQSSIAPQKTIIIAR